LFRAESFAQIAGMTTALLHPLAGFPVETFKTVAMLCAPVILVQIFQYRTGQLEFLRHPLLPRVATTVACTLLIYLTIFRGSVPQEFVYFQF